MGDMEREFDWDDTIVKDSEFVVLPAGDYSFNVESFERGHFNGSEKMPACNMATLKIKITDQSGKSTVINHNLLLHSRCEWSLSEFFTAIGQKKKGEPLRMNWQLVPGSTGRCKVGTRTYNGNEYNEIKKFYPKDETPQKPTFSAGQF